MPSASGSDLAAVPIPGAETHRLAKDASGSPCLLVRQQSHTTRSAPIRLANLFVSFGVPCAITYSGGSQEQGTFTIVRCSAADPALFPHFLRIVSPAVAALGPAPTPAAVRRAISALVELFQALTAPPKKTIQGIWAELLLIRLARDSRVLAAAWHGNPAEHFDFAAGPQRIEVKSSNCRRREHHFSLDQLTPVGGSRIVIASVFVERSGGGVSLQKLFDDTRALLAGDLALAAHFDAVFYASLGSGWADGMDEAFDWELAVDSVAFYAAAAVPRVDNPNPLLVFDVRFKADVGPSASLDPAVLEGLGGLFAAATPSR
jgi:putative PD-(D/E)XK family protein DUF4420